MKQYVNGVGRTCAMDLNTTWLVTTVKIVTRLAVIAAINGTSLWLEATVIVHAAALIYHEKTRLHHSCGISDIVMVSGLHCCRGWRRRVICREKCGTRARECRHCLYHIALLYAVIRRLLHRHRYHCHDARMPSPSHWKRLRRGAWRYAYGRPDSAVIAIAMPPPDVGCH